MFSPIYIYLKKWLTKRSKTSKSHYNYNFLQNSSSDIFFPGQQFSTPFTPTQHHTHLPTLQRRASSSPHYLPRLKRPTKKKNQLNTFTHTPTLAPTPSSTQPTHGSAPTPLTPLPNLQRRQKLNTLTPLQRPPAPHNLPTLQRQNPQLTHITHASARHNSQTHSHTLHPPPSRTTITTLSQALHLSTITRIPQLNIRPMLSTPPGSTTLIHVDAAKPTQIRTAEHYIQHTNPLTVAMRMHFLLNLTHKEIRSALDQHMPTSAYSC
ncbi:hypothetical protein HNY73_017193 [Argiope bruennichi]|uniref:Uncharacterized protein n=1 Tax=Argiope bruennichi TaxID=94029 RepID=A0A8T0EQ49_ARGBR|nr:hypothetical protein HNY73_017193 [Argiope bruennichi]